jgi:putative ABC transport system permease protein
VPNLPEDNRIVAGEAWPPDTSGLVSVEQKLADNLGIKVGDVLGFSIGGAQLEVRVSSLRSLQWDTLKPNFYMIFSPGTIEQFPTTWMTSFYLPLAQKQLLNSWHSQFPALSLLDVGQWVEQIKGLLRQLTAAIDYLLCFALVAGVCVLLTSIAASLDQRLYQGALLRTLGASRALLLRIQNLEFALLGGVSGLLAVGIAELVRFIVYQKLLQLDFGLIWQYWLVLPSLATLIVVLAARWGLRPVLKYSPLRVFRQG